MAALANPNRPDQAWKTEVQDWLLWRSSLCPARLALRFERVEWSYGELQERVSAVSALLVSWGVKRGERVCLLLNPSATYVAVVHALTRIGAVTVPLNPRQSPQELKWQINHCRPSLVLFDADLSDLKGKIRDADMREGYKWKSSAEVSTDVALRPIRGGTIDTSSLHSIIYTSGSTGTPKGVEITPSNLLWNAISFGMRHGSYPSDRWLLVMPIFHVGGYAILFRSIIHGSGIVLHQRFEATDVSESLDNEGVTLISLVPTMLNELLKVHPGPFRSSLRLIFLGGAHPPNSLLARIQERQLPVALTYGMTETCSQVATSSASTLAQRMEPSYVAMFPNTLAIKKGNAFVSRAGQSGEVVVRGPTICRGYWRNTRATSISCKGGWFHTGDAGYLDAGGGIVILGRKGDMIVTGGENIYPIEVEAPLLEHEAIEEAVVVGRKDPKWGQRVEAVVKAREGRRVPSQSELNRFLAERIGGYKIPKAYHFWRSLPKTLTQKTRRERVRQLLESEDGLQGEERAEAG